MTNNIDTSIDTTIDGITDDTEQLELVELLTIDHITHLLDEGFTMEQIKQWAMFNRIAISSIGKDKAFNMGYRCKDKYGNFISSSGLLIPFNSEFGQLRIDTKIERDDGSIVKYMTPLKTTVTPYLPYEFINNRPLDSYQIVITEGMKDCMINNFYLVDNSLDNNINNNILFGAIAGVTHYKQLEKGSGYTIIFDNDGWYNPNVMRALINAGIWCNGNINLLPMIYDKDTGAKIFKAGFIELYKNDTSPNKINSIRIVNDLVTNAHTTTSMLIEWSNRLDELELLYPDRLELALKTIAYFSVRYCNNKEIELIIDNLKKIKKVTQFKQLLKLASKVLDSRDYSDSHTVDNVTDNYDQLDSNIDNMDSSITNDKLNKTATLSNSRKNSKSNKSSNSYKSNSNSNNSKGNGNTSNNNNTYTTPNDYNGNNSINWNAPISKEGVIGIEQWNNSKLQWEFLVKSNFDFIIEAILQTKDGGAYTIKIKELGDELEYLVTLKPSDLFSPDTFTQAINRSTSKHLVLNLNKEQFNLLMVSRQSNYKHIRGGKTYKVIDRYGQQDDGTWVLGENIVDTNTGLLLTNSQLDSNGVLIPYDKQKWRYDELLGTVDSIDPPKPVIDKIVTRDEASLLLHTYLKQASLVFGKQNIYQFYLTIGWVVAGLHYQEIMNKEGYFPILNCYGDAGSMKTVSVEMALSLIGSNWTNEGIMSNISESAIYQKLSTLGSLPIVWDDPPKNLETKLDELVKALWNGKSRLVRGNNQKPHSPLGFTTNFVIGENHSATWTRIVRLMFKNYQPSSNVFSDLKELSCGISVILPYLIGIGFDKEQIKKLEIEYLIHLTIGHHRIAQSLAIVTYYTQQVLQLGNISIGREQLVQWIVDNIISSENDVDNSSDSIYQFAQAIQVLEADERIGGWNKRLFINNTGEQYVAIYTPSVWLEIDKWIKPTTYNKKTIKALVEDVGGYVTTLPFHSLKSASLQYAHDIKKYNDYIQQLENDPNPSYSYDVPKPIEPDTKRQRCLLIPYKYFDYHSFQQDKEVVF